MLRELPNRPIEGDRRHAFGADASRYIARLPDDISVIAAEPQPVPLALAAAAALRRCGTTFYAAPLLDEPRALLAQTLSGQLLQAFRTVDERRAGFDSLAQERLMINGGTPQTSVGCFEPPLVAVLRDLVIMGDAVLARSRANAQTIARVCGYTRRYTIIAPGVDNSVPRVVPYSREAIVVWAPYLPAERLGVIAMALELFKCEVIYVCASGELPDVRGSFVRPERGAESLAAARCVVDASLSDPAPALGLARLGVPIVAAGTAGVSEFMHGAFEYEPWNYRSVHAAVARACGARPPTLRGDVLPVGELHATLADAAAPTLSVEPLVSIVLATFNRPALLEVALDSIASQTYQNIETIVVNDGGCDISKLCARYPFVRLIDLADNGGPTLASHIGMTNVEGKYFAFFADDDMYFPDHFARLVYALESAGAQVGHANTLTRYYRQRPDRGWQTRAYKILHWLPNDPIEMLTGPFMAFGSMLFRRDVIDQIGYVDLTSGLVDVEYQARASERYDFIAVDAVTSQWNYSVEQNTYTHQVGQARFRASQEAIYARYPSLLASVARRRADWLQVIDDKFHSVIWPPDVYFPETFVEC